MEKLIWTRQYAADSLYIYHKQENYIMVTCNCHEILLPCSKFFNSSSEETKLVHDTQTFAFSIGSYKTRYFMIMMVTIDFVHACLRGAWSLSQSGMW